MSRSILQSPVLRSRRTERISIASPADFVRGRAVRLDAPVSGAFPYCFDFVHRRAVYVRDLDAGEVQQAPFYYLHLRRIARIVVSVPIEHGPLAASGGAASPIFLFSPGRCGSTLLSRMLNAANVTSVSEVDFYTQLATPFWSVNPLREPFRRAMWNLTADLEASLGDSAPIIKLRAEACRAPDLFVGPGRSRALFMFRAFEPWARSTCRVFGNGARKAVRKYMRALACYAYIRARGDCHVVRYEELNANPAGACAALGRFLGKAVDGESVMQAGKRDSQENTPLGRDSHRRRPGWEAKFDATMRLWASPRLALARARLGLPEVWL